MANMIPTDFHKINLLLKANSSQQLAEEILCLRKAIEDHRSKTGHHLCWQNDLELWRKTIDPNAVYPHDTMAHPEEMKAQCDRYIQSRLEGLPYEEPEVKTHAVTKDGKRIV